MDESVREALDEAGLTVNDLDVLVSHQANLRIMDAVRERLGLPESKMPVNIDRFGNTSSASIPISLDEIARAGKLEPGDRVGFCAFGGGATWGAGIMRWTMARAVPEIDGAVPAAVAQARSTT
jgi:3-oxoacyl-[acyl-carrier-protein] synthase-3